MRKLLALLLLVAVVTSAFAFANSFTVNSEPSLSGQQDISSGSAAIAACVADLEVDVEGGDFDNGTGDFIVDTVWLHANASCGGDSIKVTFTDAFNKKIITLNGELDDTGAAELNVAEKKIGISKVANVHVLIEANEPSVE